MSGDRGADDRYDDNGNSRDLRQGGAGGAGGNAGDVNCNSNSDGYQKAWSPAAPAVRSGREKNVGLDGLPPDCMYEMIQYFSDLENFAAFAATSKGNAALVVKEMMSKESRTSVMRAFAVEEGRTGAGDAGRGDDSDAVEGGRRVKFVIRDDRELKAFARIIRRGSKEFKEYDKIPKTLDIACLERLFKSLGWDMLDGESKAALRMIVGKMPGLDRIVVYEELPKFLEDIKVLREMRVVFINTPYAHYLRNHSKRLNITGLEVCFKDDLEEELRRFEQARDDDQDSSLKAKLICSSVDIDIENDALIYDAEMRKRFLSVVENTPDLQVLRFVGQLDDSNKGLVLDIVRSVKCSVPKFCRIDIGDMEGLSQDMRYEIMDAAKNNPGDSFGGGRFDDNVCVHERSFKTFCDEESLCNFVNAGGSVYDLLKDIPCERLKNIRSMTISNIAGRRFCVKDLIMLFNKCKYLEGLEFWGEIQGFDNVVWDNKIEQDSLQHLRVLSFQSSCNSTSLVSAIMQRTVRPQMMELGAVENIDKILICGDRSWLSIRKLSIGCDVELLKGMLGYCKNVEKLSLHFDKDSTGNLTDVRGECLEKVKTLYLRIDDGFVGSGHGVLAMLNDLFPNIEILKLQSRGRSVGVDDAKCMVRNCPAKLKSIDLVGGEENYDVERVLLGIKSLQEFRGVCNVAVIEEKLPSIEDARNHFLYFNMSLELESRDDELQRKRERLKEKGKDPLLERELQKEEQQMKAKRAELEQLREEFERLNHYVSNNNNSNNVDDSVSNDDDGVSNARNSSGGKDDNSDSNSQQSQSGQPQEWQQQIQQDQNEQQYSQQDWQQHVRRQDSNDSIDDLLEQGQWDMSM